MPIGALVVLVLGIGVGVAAVFCGIMGLRAARRGAGGRGLSWLGLLGGCAALAAVGVAMATLA